MSKQKWTIAGSRQFFPVSRALVAHEIRYARKRGLRIAKTATGYEAGPFQFKRAGG